MHCSCAIFYEAFSVLYWLLLICKLWYLVEKYWALLNERTRSCHCSYSVGVMSQRAHSCAGHNIVYIYSHRNNQTFEPRCTQIQVFFTVNFFQLTASLAGKGERGRGKDWRRWEDGEGEVGGDEENIQISPLSESCCLGRLCLDTAVVFSLLLPSESQAAIIRNTRGHMMPRGANVFCFPSVLNGVTHITRLTSKCWHCTNDSRVQAGASHATSISGIKRYVP